MTCVKDLFTHKYKTCVIAAHHRVEKNFNFNYIKKNKICIVSVSFTKKKAFDWQKLKLAQKLIKILNIFSQKIRE